MRLIINFINLINLINLINEKGNEHLKIHHRR
jgi:hypothetical protein